jgi:hypothetical protein
LMTCAIEGKESVKTNPITIDVKNAAFFIYSFSLTDPLQMTEMACRLNSNFYLENR